MGREDEEEGINAVIIIIIKQTNKKPEISNP